MAVTARRPYAVSVGVEHQGEDSAMQPLPELETCLRLAFEARDEAHPCGTSLSSYFVRAPTRGRRRAGLEPELLFPAAVAAQLGGPESLPMRLALDPESFRAHSSPKA